MTTKRLIRRIASALEGFDVDDDPLRRLEAVRRLREAVEALEESQVEEARDAGITWKEIGACYGLTKQGAQQRFRSVPVAQTATP